MSRTRHHSRKWDQVWRSLCGDWGWRIRPSRRNGCRTVFLSRVKRTRRRLELKAELEALKVVYEDLDTVDVGPGIISTWRYEQW